METVTLSREEVSEILGEACHKSMLKQAEYVVPVIPDLDAKILEIVKNSGTLRMAAWHTEWTRELGANGKPQHRICGTTHCRAGWAITLGTEAGYALEEDTCPELAGALIYYVSTGRIPNFLASNEDAMRDMEAMAALTEKEGCR